MLARIGINIEAITRRWMYYEFKRTGVGLLTRSKMVRIADNCAVYADEHQEEHVLPCDHVIIALGYRPNDDLAFCDEEDFPVASYRIGDCKRPGTILDAVTAGANLAARI